jgi:hypothetical protein
MDVISFLCVSLGSSTIQLHDSLGSRSACACSEAGFSSQNDDRVFGVYYRRATYFYGQGLDEKNIRKEMFPVYDGKCLSREAIHKWAKKFSRGHSIVANTARLGVEVAKTTVKRLSGCGFRCTGKAMRQMYQCWRICREINFFYRLEYQMFHVLYAFCVLFIDSPSY